MKIADTALSARARNALSGYEVHTVEDLRLFVAENGERFVKERMIGVGAVTAQEILEFLSADYEAVVYPLKTSPNAP